MITDPARYVFECQDRLVTLDGEELYKFYSEMFVTMTSIDDSQVAARMLKTLINDKESGPIMLQIGELIHDSSKELGKYTDAPWEFIKKHARYVLDNIDNPDAIKVYTREDNTK